MAKEKKEVTFDDLMIKVKSYINDSEELARITQAYEYASDKHSGQLRKSGGNYMEHLLNTCIILTGVYADTDTLCAGLLHDVIEDCDVTRLDLEEEFGEDIASLVYGVTRIGKINFSTENEALIEYYKKIIVGMSEDVRVIIIKLADRLHNMRTLWALSEDRQKAISKETLEILAPIAHRLGIQKIKSELEDLSLRYLKPNVFYDIAEKLNTTKLSRDKVVNDMLSSVSSLLKEHNIAHEIKGRSKSIYSIYKKLEKGRKFSDIYDLHALRILVDNEQECYSIIGIIHAKYKPIPKRFKDYIAMPKTNGYQSLHTTIFGIDGYLFEIQIRTQLMDEIAENGLASHWAYKENKNLKGRNTGTTEAKLQFFKSIIELNEDVMSSEEFVNSVKNEILNDNIYVFTPKGDVFELPQAATPIDFAYRVHTRVGETTTGAIVNNNIVPLDHGLKDNDIVKIITSKNSTGPSKEWINFVKSTQTKNKIKAFFNKSEKENYIERGKDYLEKELRKKKIAIHDFLADENLKIIYEETKLENLNDLYLAIGNNRYSASAIISIIHKKEPSLEDIKFKELPKTSDSDVIVNGIDKIKVNIAACCSPVPGDDIIGYISKGKGITVHKKECHNLSYLDNRMVSVTWNPNTKNRFLTTIMLELIASEKTMLEVMQKASFFDVNVDSIKTLNNGDYQVYEMDIWVRDKEHLEGFMRSLENFPFVEKTRRLIK